MSDNEELARAIHIVSKEFDGKMDKGGNPYILHCLAVMDGVRHLGHKAMSVAVMHDLIEDVPTWTAERLYVEGFSQDVINRVVALTKRKGEDYLTYVGRASSDPVTKAIKIADLAHNMNPSRLPDLTDKTMKRMKKYHTAYQFLISST